MVEWGLSERQFYEDNSFETVNKILEYRKAEAMGQAAKPKK